MFSSRIFFVILAIAFGCLMVSCSEGENQDSPIYEHVGTWSFRSMQCGGQEVQVHDFTDLIYINSSGFTEVVTGSECSIIQAGGDYLIDGRNLHLGGGEYSCSSNPCNFRYSITFQGRTVSTETVRCPDDLPTPVPVSTQSAHTVFESSTQMTLTEQSGGVECKFTYNKVSQNGTPPDFDELNPTPPAPDPGNDPPYTLVRMTGEPGNWVGAGKSHNFNQTEGAFTQLFAYPNMPYLRYTDSTTSETWHFIFSGVDGEKLEPGHYGAATYAPYIDSGTSGLSISGDGRGCNVSGNFDVLEIDYGTEDFPSKFAIDFEMYCDSGPETLSGSVRFNSIYP